MREQRRIEHDREEPEIGARLQAGIGLGARGVTAQANAASAAARAHVGHGAALRQRDAQAGRAARIAGGGGAHVRLLAEAAREAWRALTAELEERQVGAARAVQAGRGGAALRLLGVQVAALRVRVVDQVLGAVHDGEFAEAVADHELADRGRVRQKVSRVRRLAQGARRRCHWLSELNGEKPIFGKLG